MDFKKNDGRESESVTWLMDGVDADGTYLSHHIAVCRLVTSLQLQLFQNAIGSLVLVLNLPSCAYCQCSLLLHLLVLYNQSTIKLSV
jgi:hypothetical protein